MKDLKILIFTYEFPPFKGGAGIYSRDLAVGLCHLNVQVHVLTVLRSGNSESQIHGVHHHFFNSSNTIAVQQSLCRLQIKYSFDIVLITERRAQEDVAQMPLDLFPYVATIHGSEIFRYFGHKERLPVPRRCMVEFYKKAKICIAVSKATADMAERLFPGELPFVTVLNGIDPQRLRAVTEDEVRILRQSFPQKSKIVFCLGRLDADKGQEILIRAFAMVRRTCPNTLLLIGGVGPYRITLETLCKELQLDTCIKFLGEIPAVKLPVYFALCDIFVMPSKCDRRWEGFGLVYLEAAYYGKPVIGGNEGGVPEAIAHQKNGLLVDPRDSKKIADSITSLLTNQEKSLAMGDNGRQRVINYFNAKRMAKDTLSHLHALLYALPSQSPKKVRLWEWNLLCGLRLFKDKLSLLSRRLWQRIR